MGATLATVNNILKEIYEGDIRDQLNTDTVGLKRIERSSEGVTSEVGGKYVTFPVRVRRNAGIGARAEMEALPTAGQQGYNAARVSLAYLYGLVRLSGQTIELADSNFQAFASALDQEISGLKSDLAKDNNRQFYGTAVGTMATVTVLGTTVNTVQLLASTGAQYMEIGQQVDLIDGTTLANATPTVKASNRQVTAVNVATGVVTLSGAAFSSAVGDVLVRTGNANREMIGLKSIIAASGALYNIDPSTEPVWAGFVDSNSGTLRALSEGLMILQIDKVRAGGSKVSAIFCNLGVRRAYFNLLQQQRRFTNTQEFEGGFSGLAFTTDQGDIPVVVDVDAPYNTMEFVDEKNIKLYQEKDWSFMDRDGSMWQRVVGYDAYEAVMYKYCNLGTHKRNAHAVLQDITEG